MIYEYTNPATGAKFQINASMKDAPATEIVVVDPREPVVWRDATEFEVEIQDPAVFYRDFSSLQTSVVDLAVRPNGRGLPVSAAAPRLKGGKIRKVGGHILREHDSGIITNAKGQPLVDSNEAARRVAKHTGMDID